jgi:hypothetical protein
VDRLAFNPQGTRIAVVTTVEKEKVLSIYRLQGGGLSLLQSERLDRVPEYLLVGDRLIVGDRLRADVFDYRK